MSHSNLRMNGWSFPLTLEDDRRQIQEAIDRSFNIANHQRLKEISVRNILLRSVQLKPEFYESDCGICLNQMSNVNIQLRNCLHSYCSSCILDFIRHVIKILNFMLTIKSV